MARLPLRSRVATKFGTLAGPSLLVHTGDSAMVVRWAWASQFLRPGNLRTLDAGSGSGAFSILMAVRGNDVTGLNMEISQNQKAAERAAALDVRDNCRFITMDLGDLAHHHQELGTFDQILCLEVAEHIIEDQKLVRDLSALLAPGGILIMTSPYLHSKRLPGDHLSAVQDGGHVRWGYTSEQFGHLLQQASLEIVESDYICGVISQSLIRGHRQLACYLPAALAWVLMLPGRILLPFDRTLSDLLNYPYLCVAVVGTRRS